MCSNHTPMAWYKSRTFLFILALLFAALTAYCQSSVAFGCAELLADIFMKLLKLLSIPILFFSLMTVFSSIGAQGQTKKIVASITRYTIFTTLIAASTALLLVHLFGLLTSAPVAMNPEAAIETVAESATHFRYSEWILNAIPSNIVGPFTDNNAIAALILALLLGYATSKLPQQQKETVHQLVSSIYKLLMETTIFIVRALPLILWAFLTLLFQQMSHLAEMETLMRYLIAVFTANLIQGLIFLPLFLQFKGISPVALFRVFSPALTMAFITKSSSATVPLAIRCATKGGLIRESTASISFPLCTSINMNGCAAFILTTVLCVGSMHGVYFSAIDQLIWIGVATLAAIGNAGVPMGCYFLSCALLASMDIPLNAMGAILPFYALIDAVETALNVWSDCSITAVVEKDSLPMAN